jgi:hypothetical protein
MVETSTCDFCKKKKFAADKDHKVISCPICEKDFTCTYQLINIGEHLDSKECIADFCPTDGYFDGTKPHGKTCVKCNEVFDCKEEYCHNGCCQKCGLDRKECHCKGPCKDPACLLNINIEQNRSSPQHSTSLLVKFGIDERGRGSNIRTKAQEFYGCLALMDKYPEKRAEGQKLLEAIAEHMFMSIIAACSGEFRYTRDAVNKTLLNISLVKQSGKGTLTQDKKRATRLKFSKRWQYTRPFGVGEFWSLNDESSNSGRSGAAEDFMHTVLPHGRIHATRILRNWFAWHYMGSGKGGYGGPLWGQAADLAYRFAKGEISEIVFIDSCFDLQHNNGSLFTKTHYIPMEFKSWLDRRAREEDTNWFLNQTPKWLKAVFEPVEEDKKPDYPPCPLMANAMAKKKVMTMHGVADGEDTGEVEAEPETENFITHEHTFHAPVKDGHTVLQHYGMQELGSVMAGTKSNGGTKAYISGSTQDALNALVSKTEPKESNHTVLETGELK